MTDLIKREDAIKVVESFLGTDPIAERIKRLPSADRPQGEWIDNGDRYFRCSLCGIKDTDKWHWCHGCGAQMKGAQ